MSLVSFYPPWKHQETWGFLASVGNIAQTETSGMIWVKERTFNFAKTTVYRWGKVFKNGQSKICGRQPLKNLKWYGLPRQTISLQIFLRLSSTNFTWSTLQYFAPFAPFVNGCFRQFTKNLLVYFYILSWSKLKS